MAGAVAGGYAVMRIDPAIVATGLPLSSLKSRYTASGEAPRERLSETNAV